MVEQINHNLPEYVDTVFIKELNNHVIHLTIHLHERSTSMFQSNESTFIIEERENWNYLILQHELINKITSGSYRNFESRSKETFEVVYIPTIEFLSPKVINHIKDKEKFKSYFNHL